MSNNNNNNKHSWSSHGKPIKVSHKLQPSVSSNTNDILQNTLAQGT